jgi:hypothetical protein
MSCYSSDQISFPFLLCRRSPNRVYDSFQGSKVILITHLAQPLVTWHKP